MWIANLPPFLPFFIGAVVACAAPARWRSVLTLLVPVWGLVNLYLTSEDATGFEVALHTFTLQLFDVDKLSLIFGYLFHVAALIASVFALHNQKRPQQIASLVYIGSALGAVFAGDILTLFLFWECLALSSAMLVWCGGQPESAQNGLRYLIFQVVSGLLLFAGISLLYPSLGLLDSSTYLSGFLTASEPAQRIAAWLILLAFGIKCAFPFLHSWLVDAYPTASASGTVFLSAFTTKVAVYALARYYAGTELLVYVGVVMACFPIFYAVIENDLRKVLAYSLINQLGFMVVGIGIGTQLGVNGAVAHVVSDVIFKGLLFMSMGAVLFRVGHVLGSDLGGLYKSMPKTALFCMVGAASISAFPLFSGFVSKSMIMSAMIESGYDQLWLAMLFASAGVFHHAGIKIPFFAFFAHDRGHRVAEAPGHMLLAMGAAASLCLFIGIFPQYVYALLPFETDYWPYDLTHSLTQIQLLLFSALAFVWLNKAGLYPPELRSTNLDMEWCYRRWLPDRASTLISSLAMLRGWSVRLACAGAKWIPEYQHQHHWTTGQLTQRLVGLLAVLLLLGSWLLG